MNEMEEFLNFAAVIKIRRSYDDDLFKFIELMKSVGFLKEYAEHFERSCCFDKKLEEFSENVFWHYVEINNGNKNDTCLEFQWGKGFTWGNRKDYLSYDSEMEILNVDDLIRSCNKEELFKMNYEYTNFQEELEDKKSASDLDQFLDFYEWSITKYPDGKYNIKDEQCNTFDFEENTTFDNIIDRVYFRMFDYFIDEEDIEGLIEENEFNYVKSKYESYMETGEKLGLIDNLNRKQYESWFQEIVKKNNEKNKKNDIENLKENFSKYPLLKRYIISSEDKQLDFYNHFSSEQLEDFEESLNQYFNECSIIYHKDSYDEFESKEDANFNRDILRLACGLITYEDFIKDYTEHSLNYYELSLPKVIEYFKENQIDNLMDYGCDSDEGLNKLSSLYRDIMDELNIKYSNIFTEDGISPGKYITVITFEDNSEIVIDTKGSDKVENVTNNIESIYENYEKSKQREVKNDEEFDYDYN